MAKDSVDDMGNRLGAVVLETIRGAKLPLLLRSGKLLDRSRTLAGKPANFFLASHRPSAFSDSLCGGSSGRISHREALDRRHRIHVRCTLASVPAPAQFVSCGDASVTSLGDLASGLRQTGMETADTHNVDRGPNQLFLAARAGCELGTRAFLPRAACDAGLELSAALSARPADAGLLANTSIASGVGRETECCSRGASIYTVIIFRMKFLIIGGTGFISRPLVRELQKRQHKVAVFHRGRTPASFKGVEIILGDRKNLEQYREDFQRFAPDTVIHMILSSGRHAEALMRTVRRLPMVYGPGDPLHRFFPMLKRIVDRRTRILMFDEMAAWRSPRGYVENVAAAIALAACSDRAVGEIYNVAEEPAFSELEWARQIAAQARWDGEFTVLPRERTPKHLLVPGNFRQHGIASSNKIRQELGFQEPVSIADAIRRTIAWEKENPPAEISQEQFDYPAEDRAVAA